MTKDDLKQCCVCGDNFTGRGNNPEPFQGEFACHDCDNRFVTPARMCLGSKFNDENILALLQTFAELGKCLTRLSAESQKPRLVNETAKPQ